MESSIQPRVIEIVAEQLSLRKADVRADSLLVNDLGADSLDVVELIMEMEEEFGLEIPDSDIENIKSVKDIVEYVSKRV